MPTNEGFLKKMKWSIANPESRHKVEMYWTHLDNDIEYISHRYDY